MSQMYDLNLGLPAGIKVTVSDAASAKSAELAAGCRYMVTASTPTHIRLGATGAAAVVTDFLLGTGQVIDIRPTSGSTFLHGICPAGGSGTLHAVLRTQ